MKYFKFFLYIFFICFQSVDAFNVKVLLACVPKKSLTESPIVLKSTTGFFIGKSGQDYSICSDKKIVISEKNGFLLINQEETQRKEIFFRSQISLNQNKEIAALVKSWIHDEKNNIKISFEKLEELCNNLVVKNQHAQALESEKLETFFLNWLHRFCEHLIRDKHNAAVLQSNLQQAAKNKVYACAKHCFVKKVSELNISKLEYEKLGKNKDFRINFFYEVALKCLHEIAIDFLLTLPDHDIRRVIKGGKHGIEYNSGMYWGEFYIIEQKEDYLVINCLDIDDYLVSVLHHEGWPGWPLEANKTLMVAARSYLVSKILEAVRCKRLYHIKNTISHQTYKGYCKVEKSVLRAAEETRDLIMTYKGKPAEAMFDSCCGGVIPAKIEGFSFEKVPYLARKKICTYCKPCWVYRWKSDFTSQQLLKKIQGVFPELKKINDIRVISRDEAKLVKKVMISDGKKKYYVSGKKMYSLFSEIKSFCFNIKRKNKNFVIHGRGYGHHMGLCQWGARQMVDANWNYRSILKFYYPGVEFVQLSYL